MTDSTHSSRTTDALERQIATDNQALRAILLPVKDLRGAKQRLATVLTQEERTALAHAMLGDTVRALQQVQLADAIFVVTNYDTAIEIAAANSWQILREEQQVSESASVDFAS